MFHRRILRAAGAVVIAAVLLAGFAVPCRAGLPDYRGPREGAPSPEAAAVAEQVRQAHAEIAEAGRAGAAGDEKSARAHLDRAESILRKALDRDPHSRDAAVTLGAAWLYRGAYGDRKATGRCIEFLTRVLEVDPYAVHAARYLTHAYHRLGDGASAVYYANYVETISNDPALLREVGEIRTHYQEEFLAGWDRHGDFYESPESRVEQYDPKTFRKQVVLQITPELERQLAGRSVQQLGGQLPLASDEPTRAYLQKLVDKLAARTPGPPFTHRVELVASSDPNALALPGHIFVNTGLITFAENEAELVAVLAHELGHVYAHHSARELVMNTRTGLLKKAILAEIDLDNELHEQLLDLGAEIGLELIRRGYNRSQEKEADRYGTHIAFNAGYNPTYLTGFFLRMYELNPNHPWKLLATHPPTSERIEYTTEYLMNFPLDREMTVDSKEFQEVKARLGGGGGGTRP
jgi:predicted Zn-dependent protease